MSLYTIRSGGTSHPESSVLQEITDLIKAGGVQDLSSTNHFKVTEKSGTPDMSVDIAPGHCFIKGTGNCYPARNTVTINQTIPNNSSGNTRIDAIVIYIDLAASPDSTASNVAKITVVEGTPAASPVAPTNSEIQTAIGASNPFLRLANVTVDDAETQIQDADIEDKRVQFLLNATRGIKLTARSAPADADVDASEVHLYGKALGAVTHLYAKSGDDDEERFIDTWNLVTLSDGATVNIDWEDGSVQTLTLGGNRTLEFDNPVTGGKYVLILKQDATGGRTVTWPANVKWTAGSAPVLSTGANDIDIFGFIYDGTNWYGVGEALDLS